MRGGFKKAAALLLPAFVASLVVPADRAVNSGIEPIGAEDPASRRPFIFEYRAEDEASIRFALPSDGVVSQLTEQENGIIEVTVLGSDRQDCSDASDTDIRVNGEPLVSAISPETTGRHVLERAGSTDLSETGAKLGHPSLASWTLQCACLDALSTVLSGATDKCDQLGYILTLQFLSDTSAEVADGFTLSFTQSPQPKLLRLTSLLRSAIIAPSSLQQELANARHWLGPLLHPIKNFIGQVPTSTVTQLLTAQFSTTAPSSFLTVTTALGAGTTPAPAQERGRWATDRSAAHATLSRSGKSSSSSDTLHDELDGDLFRSESASPSRTTESKPSRPSLETAAAEFEAPGTVFVDDSVDDSEDDYPVPDANETEEVWPANAVKEFFYTASTRAQKTLHSVVQKITRFPYLSSQTTLDAARPPSKMSQIHDDILLNATLPGSLDLLPEIEITPLQVIGLTSFLLLTVGGTVFACVWFQDPRRRAERAARREERINRCLYKQAARKHKFRTFLNRICGRKAYYEPQADIFARAQTTHSLGPSRNSMGTDLEWHSKEVTLVEQDSIDGVHKEISELREAHGFVEGILRATSGMYRGHKRLSPMARHQRRYSDVASEKSVLPPYTTDDEEGEEQIVEVDGLHFSVRRRCAAVGSTSAGASSIIDTSPRWSDCGSSDSEKE